MEVHGTPLTINQKTENYEWEEIAPSLEEQCIEAVERNFWTTDIPIFGEQYHPRFGMPIMRFQHYDLLDAMSFEEQQLVTAEVAMATNKLGHELICLAAPLEYQIGPHVRN